MERNCFFFSFFFFLQRLTRQILLNNARLETLVCRGRATLEISKRYGNSRQNFATEEETFLVTEKN